MGMSYGLFQEQTQKLVMTQQMQQAITVLQFTAIELEQYVAAEVDANPLAEYDPVDVAQTPWTSRAYADGAPFGGRVTDRAAPPLEQVVQAETTLSEILESQLRLSSACSDVAATAQILIGCLDENGYLREPLAELARWLGVSLDTAEAALAVIQTFDPPGIGARNLRECLMLQLGKVPELLRPLVGQLIESHLEDVAAARVSAISRRLRVSPAAVQQALDALRQLNPRPGLLYAHSQPGYIVPDVIVEHVGERYVVLSNERAQPTVRISAAYRRLLDAPDIQTSQFVQHKLQAAQWLMKCLEQRRLTLYRVADAVVSVQQEFLRRGLGAMRPLTLRQIADVLGVHESTVSRATRGKYMQTPRGVFELRYFFCAEIKGADGVGSAQAAKHHIRRLIESECDGQPLSDESICHQLDSQGIQISRRTVAKYRESMDIPASAHRRRY